MHRETKETRISKATKVEVYKRDKGKCIICGSDGLPNAHYKRRSQGGLGIPENIVTLCPKCHHDFDNGFKRREYEEKIKRYLDDFYPDFDDYDRIYHKY